MLGAAVAIVSAVVGVVTVLRSQSFAGHALTDVATAGGAGASYLGFSALSGFLGGSVVGAGAMEVVGVERARSRDVATGVVLGAATGVSALFLYLNTTVNATTGATQQILFGSIFTVANSTIPVVILIGTITLAVLGLIGRRLLLSSLSGDIAAARGINTRLVGMVFIMTLAVAVGLSSIAIGSILSTALLIGPAATSLRLTRRMPTALLLAVGLGVGSTWLGILFAYDSYDWDRASQGLPVSFFIVAVSVTGYLLSGLPMIRRRVARRPNDAAALSLLAPSTVGTR